MLHFIHSELFGFNQTKKTTEKGEYFATNVTTSPDVVRKDSDKDVGNAAPYYPRTLVRINSSAEDYLNDVFHNIVRRERDDGSVFVTVYANDKIQSDKTILFVAFPFDGIMIPVGDTPGFIIHRGAHVHSAKRTLSVTNNDGEANKFRNAVYFVIEVDDSAFSNPSGESRRLKFVAYNRVSHNNNGEPSTDALTMSDRFTLKINVTSNGCFINEHPVLTVSSSFEIKRSLPFYDTTKYRGMKLFQVTDLKKPTINPSNGIVKKDTAPVHFDTADRPRTTKEPYSFKHPDSEYRGGKDRKGNGRKKKKMKNRKEDRFYN